MGPGTAGPSLAGQHLLHSISGLLGRLEQPTTQLQPMPVISLDVRSGRGGCRLWQLSAVLGTVVTSRVICLYWGPDATLRSGERASEQGNAFLLVQSEQETLCICIL